MNRHDRRAAARSIRQNYAPKIQCATHGSSPWGGEVICTACNAVWKLDGDDRLEPPVEVEGLCTCGAELCGDKGTARAICADLLRGPSSAAGAEERAVLMVSFQSPIGDGKPIPYDPPDRWASWRLAAGLFLLVTLETLPMAIVAAFICWWSWWISRGTR